MIKPTNEEKEYLADTISARVNNKKPAVYPHTISTLRRFEKGSLKLGKEKKTRDGILHIKTKRKYVQY